MNSIIRKILQNISTRIIFIIYLLIILTTVFFLSYGYYNNLELQEQRQFDKLRAIVVSIGNNINGDEHQQLTDNFSIKDEVQNVDQSLLYNKIYKILNQAEVQNKLNSPLYTLLFDSTSQQFKYIVRSDSNVYYRHSYINSPDILLKNMESGGTIPMYRSENGTWLSAFHPIRNSKGKVIAILEADISFDEFSSIVKKQFFNQAMISIIVIILLALIFIPFTRQILDKDYEQKLLFRKQSRIISEKNKDMMDSINYALKIQKSILPSLANLKKHFQDYFILFQPKDIVSGDFYWSYEDEDYIYLAVADSTGHGVPGSMVSIVCSNALNRAVIQLNLTNTAEILNQVKKFVIHSFQDGMSDGMDLCFCRINKNTKELQFSGANNSLYLYSQNKLTVLKASRQPIGRYIKKEPFISKNLQLKKGDVIYLFTDGYYDQFGGENNKKMKIKALKSLLLNNHQESMSKQKDVFENYLNDWKGNNEQLDDITILGVKI